MANDSSDSDWPYSCSCDRKLPSLVLLPARA